MGATIEANALNREYLKAVAKAVRDEYGNFLTADYDSGKTQTRMIGTGQFEDVSSYGRTSRHEIQEEKIFPIMEKGIDLNGDGQSTAFEREAAAYANKYLGATTNISPRAIHYKNRSSRAAATNYSVEATQVLDPKKRSNTALITGSPLGFEKSSKLGLVGANVAAGVIGISNEDGNSVGPAAKGSLYAGLKAYQTPLTVVADLTSTLANGFGVTETGLASAPIFTGALFLNFQVQTKLSPVTTLRATLGGSAMNWECSAANYSFGVQPETRAQIELLFK